MRTLPAVAALLASSIGLALSGCPQSESNTVKSGRVADPVTVHEQSKAASGPAGPARMHPAFNERAGERAELVRSGIAGQGVRDERVLRAMRTVPRHAFVPDSVADEAYANRPLPIGNGQTISQPYIVAAMTEAGAPLKKDRCLEIGTGSGYQAAVLAEVCARVYSIEYLPEVARFGEKNLRKLGYGPARVKLRVGDGYRGWPEAAPFDVILVTAAPDHVPQPLLDQLAVGGRLVIPVGPEHGDQYLQRWLRLEPGKGDSAFKREALMGVRFVPFLGEGKKD